MMLRESGVTLVAVVLAILVLSLMGWSLAQLYSSGTDVNSRLLDAERALWAAEAGIAWGIHEAGANPGWVTDNGDDDCADPEDWVTHTYPGGQYQACCRNATGAETESATFALISRGYVPSVDSYRALREVKLLASLGSSNAFTGGGIFDWTDVPYSSMSIDGPVYATSFQGNGGDANEDYDKEFRMFPSETSPRTVINQPMVPELNMTMYDLLKDYYYADLTVTPATNFKSGGIWYIDGNLTIDTSAVGKKPAGISVEHIYFICTGNITVTGTGILELKAQPKSSGKCYPNLASKNGWIDGSTVAGIISDGTIFAEQGELRLRNITGGAVLIAPEIYLHEKVDLDNPDQRVDLSRGFRFGVGEDSLVWREQ